jgi:hypothetical protein
VGTSFRGNVQGDEIAMTRIGELFDNDDTQRLIVRDDTQRLIVRGSGRAILTLEDESGQKIVLQITMMGKTDAHDGTTEYQAQVIADMCTSYQMEKA